MRGCRGQILGEVGQRGDLADGAEQPTITSGDHGLGQLNRLFGGDGGNGHGREGEREGRGRVRSWRGDYPNTGQG